MKDNKNLSDGEIKIAMLTLNNRYKVIQNEIKQKLNELQELDKEYVKLAKRLKDNNHAEYINENGSSRISN